MLRRFSTTLLLSRRMLVQESKYCEIIACKECWEIPLIHLNFRFLRSNFSFENTSLSMFSSENWWAVVLQLMQITVLPFPERI